MKERNTDRTTGSAADARKQRLAAVLRENLKRRKAQARGRDAASGEISAGRSAEIAPERPKG